MPFCYWLAFIYLIVGVVLNPAFFLVFDWVRSKNWADEDKYWHCSFWWGLLFSPLWLPILILMMAGACVVVLIFSLYALPEVWSGEKNFFFQPYLHRGLFSGWRPPSSAFGGEREIETKESKPKEPKT